MDHNLQTIPNYIIHPHHNALLPSTLKHRQNGLKSDLHLLPPASTKYSNDITDSSHFSLQGDYALTCSWPDLCGLVTPRG